MKKILFVFFLINTGICAVKAQVPTPSQVQQMKAEDISDDQVKQIVEEMKKNRITIDQLDGFAQQKGIPSSEVSRLKSRIRDLNLAKDLVYDQAGASISTQPTNRTLSEGTIVSARDVQPMSLTDLRRAKIFGADLFTNSNLTFEPNLRMATPPNYKLGAGDEIMIDVYGYSEVQHKVSVSPEGYVRIPYVGPVFVNGLTMEEAKTRITKQLATIYGGIKSGNTFVQISLGAIRSIRVLLIGEVARPGTYTVPSLATIANALYVSGGPDVNGSFRDIQVIRNGSPIVTFDLYDFLRNGDLTNNIVLQDQDIVKVNPYKTRIELAGEVKRPAIFEIKEGETLQNALDLAGGYTDISYKNIIRAYRINNKEREVINIPAAELPGFVPKSGDKFFVDAILNRFSNRVKIGGSVLHPGEYALEENMTVAELIKKASGIREDASQSRAIIFRQREDMTPTAINFSLEEVLAGRQQVKLHREDSVVIYSKLQLIEEYYVRISGEVNKPGYFKYSDSLQIVDLILQAGGLRDAATLKRIEISRRVRGKDDFNPADSISTIIAQFDLAADPAAANNFILQPFDEIVIRRSPNYEVQLAVSIGGEVIYPGYYTINSKKERISDLLRRAGGLRPEAYPDGAVLLRRTFTTASDSALLDSKMQVFYSKLKDSAAISRMGLTAYKKEQLLGINLPAILRNPGSQYDLLLEEGDIIKVPKKLETVQLYGEIYFPKKVRFDKRTRFRDYIRGAGGFTRSSLKRRSYVVYANGDVKSTKRLLFFNSYPKVKPGAEIYVPSKKEGKSISAGEMIGIGTGIASLALIITTILNK